MKDGHAQAFSRGTQIPAGSIMDLAAARDIKLIDQSDSYEKMRKLDPGYTLMTLPPASMPSPPPEGRSCRRSWARPRSSACRTAK